MKRIVGTVAGILASLAAGFLGGVLGARYGKQPKSPTPEIVRARSFELVDAGGRALSYWGTDQNDQAVLTFGDPQSPRSGDRPLRVLQNQRTTLGVAGGSGFLDLRGSNGMVRCSLALGFDKARLVMWDERGARVLLGVDHSDTPNPSENDWTLRFSPDRAAIGTRAVKEGGRTYWYGYVGAARDKVTFP